MFDFLRLSVCDGIFSVDLSEMMQSDAGFVFCFNHCYFPRQREVAILLQEPFGGDDSDYLLVNGLAFCATLINHYLITVAGKPLADPHACHRIHSELFTDRSVSHPRPP